MAISKAMAALMSLAIAPVAAIAVADVGDTCEPAVPPGPACPACTLQTILVPQIVYENRTVTTVCWRPEICERTILSNRTVWETENVPREYTVEVPQTHIRQVAHIVEQPVYHDFVMRTTVAVPHTDMRTTTRMVSRMVPVQEQKTICELAGHWETRAGSATPYSVGYGSEGSTDALSPATEPASRSDGTFKRPRHRLSPPDAEPPSATAAACSSCAAAVPCATACATRVWVPETLQRTVNVTSLRPVCQEQTVRYPVTVFQADTHDRDVQFVTYRRELVTREEQYTVLVPQQRVKIEQVRVARTVPVQERQPYTVMVPYHEQHQVRVAVCRWVAKTVAVTAPSCGAAVCH
jgi:hypothetical protein